jgi:putative tryptophan/tyrosine transport system ATP-binding protein
MLKLTNLKKTFGLGTPNEKGALFGVSFNLAESDFVTIIGGNGAGKSTTLNAVAGLFLVDSGTIEIDNIDVTNKVEYKRAKYIGRVFQDPRMGTTANMSIEENLAIAYRRGKPRTLKWGITKIERELFREELKTLDLGLENRLKDKAGLLSGGQRQALTLLMATIVKPKLLLLDEHTAALDPKTAKVVLELTKKLVFENKSTAIMVTHNMTDALKIGNRIIMMNEGSLVLDIGQEEKNNLTKSDLLKKFEKISGEED